MDGRGFRVVFLFFGAAMWILAAGSCFLAFLALTMPYGSLERLGVIGFLLLFSILAVFAGLKLVRLGIGR
jgi:hypothetical protein